jgi:hypothetical protein
MHPMSRFGHKISTHTQTLIAKEKDRPKMGLAFLEKKNIFLMIYGKDNNVNDADLNLITPTS